VGEYFKIENVGRKTMRNRITIQKNKTELPVTVLLW
jgi:hypothetical protein